MKTENIRKFLAAAYSDEKLAALLAHAQDGKLRYYSCCCFVGVATANHALREETENYVHEPHYMAADTQAKELTGSTAWAASIVEYEYCCLGQDDAERRKNLIPLILEEMTCREERKLDRAIEILESQCDEFSAKVQEGSKMLTEARENLSEALKGISLTGDFAVTEAERKLHGRAHRLQQEHAERFPEE